MTIEIWNTMALVMLAFLGGFLVGMLVTMFIFRARIFKQDRIAALRAEGDEA